jgi:hypothetical protein
MTTNTPRNIFEAVGKSEHERRNPVLKETLPAETTQPSSISKMLEHCRDLHENIASSLDRIFNSKGITHTQYRNYVSNQRNFSSKDWEVIEQAQKNTTEELEKLSLVTNPKGAENASVPIEGVKKKEEAKKMLSPRSSEPKRKPISRRQWLQMH